MPPHDAAVRCRSVPRFGNKCSPTALPPLRDVEKGNQHMRSAHGSGLRNDFDGWNSSSRAIRPRDRRARYLARPGFGFAGFRFLPPLPYPPPGGFVPRALREGLGLRFPGIKSSLRHRRGPDRNRSSRCAPVSGEEIRLSSEADRDLVRAHRRTHADLVPVAAAWGAAERIAV